MGLYIRITLGRHIQNIDAWILLEMNQFDLVGSPGDQNAYPGLGLLEQVAIKVYGFYFLLRECLMSFKAQCSIHVGKGNWPNIISVLFIMENAIACW